MALTELLTKKIHAFFKSVQSDHKMVPDVQNIYTNPHIRSVFVGGKRETLAGEMFERYFVIRKQHVRNTENGALIILLYGSMMDALGVSVAYIKNVGKQSS